MHTLTDLQDEFEALAAAAPSDAEVRAALAGRMERHARRRRTTALIAVAAAVVLLAGGVGVTRAFFAHGPALPAGPSPVVTVPDVPLPAGTKLIRFQLQPVTSPVTATPPKGLTGQVWSVGPGRLAVSWFDPAQATTMAVTSGDTVNWSRTAGYAITATRDDTVTTFGQGGTSRAQVHTTAITVAGHQATLETTPAGSVDSMGFPAEERISWELSDGRWIHVWATGGPTRDSQPSPTLAAFAESITEKPQTLMRTLGIGLTLPGLTAEYSIDYSQVAGFAGPMLLLCPAGVDPYGTGATTASGSGSASAPQPGEPSAGPSMSIEPGAGQTSSENHNPADPCITAAVVNGSDVTSQLHPTPVKVGNTVAQVDVQQHVAVADLGRGLTAVVSVPASAHLSEADLAALVASVRVSPDVTVLPVPQGNPAATEQGSSSAVASTSSTATDLPTRYGSPCADPAFQTSCTATPAPPGQVTPFVIPGGRPFTSDVSDRTVTLTFSMQNITDEAVTLQGLSIDAARLAQTSVRVRPDKGEPQVSDSPFGGSALPVEVAPRAMVRVQISLALQGCTPVADDNPPLVVTYETHTSGGQVTQSSGGQVSLALPYGSGWVTDVTKSLCG
jgi:hypothetical protein